MGLFTLPKSKTFKETYISGLPGFNRETILMIEVRKTQVVLKIFNLFKITEFIIDEKDIVELSYNQEVYRSAGKAAAGAIIGGVLTGGIGLLAGAAIGGKRRKEGDFVFSFNYQGQVCNLELKPRKNLSDLYKEIKKILTVRAIAEPVKNSNADELLKFADLRDKGIISNEEFETKKRQLLGL